MGYGYIVDPTSNELVVGSTGSLLRVSTLSPINKTAIMTQEVGVDSDGKLYTAPSSGNNDSIIAETSSSITLVNNTEYEFSNAISSLTLTAPSGNYECYLHFTTASSGTITITFPSGSKYIGEVPEFSNSEEWEVSIKNGIVAACKVVSE